MAKLAACNLDDLQLRDIYNFENIRLNPVTNEIYPIHIGRLLGDLEHVKSNSEHDVRIMAFEDTYHQDVARVVEKLREAGVELDPIMANPPPRKSELVVRVAELERDNELLRKGMEETVARAERAEAELAILRGVS